MSPSKRITHRLSAVMAGFGIFAVAAGFVIGMTGWPPALATASAEPVPVSSDATLSLAATTDSTTAPIQSVESSSGSLLLGAVAAPRSLALGIAPARTAKHKMLRAVPKPKHSAKRALKRAKLRVRRPARRLRVGRWSHARVSWYGPGFYGHTMAGGGRLTRTSLVVAHRSLPFGTRVQISYRGRTVIATVRDRGPYVSGRTFDLGPGTARRLGFGGVGTIRYRIVR